MLGESLRRVAIAVGVAIISAVNYSNHAALIPLLMPGLGVGAAQMGFVSTALFATSAVLMIPFGHWSDRYGAKWVIAGGLGILAAANLIMPFSYGGFVVAKGIMGLGTGACFMGGLRYIDASAAAERRHLSQGWFGAGMLLGVASGLYAVPFLLRWMDWTATFRVLGWATLAYLVVWLLGAIAHPPRVVDGSALSAGILRASPVWTLGWIHCAGFGMALVVGTWLTKLMVDRYAMSLAPAGLASSVAMFGALVARPAGGWLVSSRGWSREALFLAGTVATAAGLLALALHLPVLAAYAAIAVLGVGTGLPYSAVFEAAANLYRERAGAVQGLVSMVATLFVVVGAPLVGWVIELSGYSAAMALLGLVALSAVWTVTRLERQHRPVAQPR